MNKEYLNTIRQYDEQKTELTDYVSKKANGTNLMNLLTYLAMISTVRVYDIMEKDEELNEVDLMHLCVKLGALTFAESFIQRSFDN